MSDPNAVSLTSKDYALLETLLAAPGDVFSGSTMFIRRKLRSATLVFPTDIDANVVTLNSRVRYRIDGGASEERVVVAKPGATGTWPILALDCARGIALLGASVGQQLDIPRQDGSFETLQVEAVLYQPEAHGEVDTGAGDGPGAGEASPVRLATVSQFSAFRQRQNSPPRDFDGDDDDPGPSAA